MFWRREFWIRPAFMVLVALGCVAAVPFIARHGVESMQAQHLVDARVLCGDASTVPGTGSVRCLEPVRDDATVWTWRGGVVGVEVPYDAPAQSEGPASVLVPVWGLGGRGAAQAFLLVVGGLGGAVAAADYAWRTRRTRGSWPTDTDATIPGSRRTVGDAAAHAVMNLRHAGLAAAGEAVPWAEGATRAPGCS